MKFTLLEKKKNSLKLEVSIPRILNLSAQKPKHYDKRQVEALVMEYVLKEHEELKKAEELKIEGKVKKMWNKFSEGLHRQVIELTWKNKKTKKNQSSSSNSSSPSGVSSPKSNSTSSSSVPRSDSA